MYSIDNTIHYIFYFIFLINLLNSKYGQKLIITTNE